MLFVLRLLQGRTRAAPEKQLRAAQGARQHPGPLCPAGQCLGHPRRHRAKWERGQQQISPSVVWKPPYCRKRLDSRRAIWSRWETRPCCPRQLPKGESCRPRKAEPPCEGSAPSATRLASPDPPDSTALCLWELPHSLPHPSSGHCHVPEQEALGTPLLFPSPAQGQRQGTAQRGPAKRLQHLQFHGAERAAGAAGGTARCCPWPWRARNIGTPEPTSLFQNGLVPGPPPLLLPGYQHARTTTAPSRTPSHQDHHNSFLNTIVPNFPNGSFMLSTSPGATSVHQTAVVHGQPQHRDKSEGWRGP